MQPVVVLDDGTLAMRDSQTCTLYTLNGTPLHDNGEDLPIVAWVPNLFAWQDYVHSAERL